MAQLNVDEFAKRVFAEGTISTLIGLPGSGKTNLAVDYMDIATLRGYNVYTNIGFFGVNDMEKACALNKLSMKPEHYIPKNPQIHTVKSLSDLFIGLLTTERNLTIVDEGGIHMPSGRSTSAKVQTWKELAYIIRHLSSAEMILAQSKKSVVPDLRETLVEFEIKVRKLSDYDRMFTIATAIEKVDDYTGESSIAFEVAEGDEYHQIPPARYPFDSKDFPYFETDDIDIHDAFKALKEFNSITVREDNNGINAIMKLRGDKRTEVDYLSTRQYAKKYGAAMSTVRNWVKRGRVQYITTTGGYFKIRDKPPIHKENIEAFKASKEAV